MDINPYSPPTKETNAPDESFYRRAYRFGVILVGVTISFVGLLGLLVSVAGVVDRAGAQQADDADPFGAPPGFWSVLGTFGLFAALTVIGAFLILRVGRKRVRQNGRDLTSR